jgi:hypothetical protein
MDLMIAVPTAPPSTRRTARSMSSSVRIRAAMSPASAEVIAMLSSPSCPATSNSCSYALRRSRFGPTESATAPSRSTSYIANALSRAVLKSASLSSIRSTAARSASRLAAPRALASPAISTVRRWRASSTNFRSPVSRKPRSSLAADFAASAADDRPAM